MSLISVVFILVLVGIGLALINKYVPMEATIKTIINVVVIVAVLIWLATLFGILPDIGVIRVGK